jgi:hypothetical protein
MSSAALGNLVRRRAAGSANDAWRNVGAEMKASPNRMYAVALKRSARNDDAAQPLRSCRLNNFIDRVRIDAVAAALQCGAGGNDAWIAAGRVAARLLHGFIATAGLRRGGG